MRILKINRSRPSKAALAEAVRILRSGGVVAFPTETSYGLAADPTDAAAVARIYAIKSRDAGKPLPLIAASTPQVRRIAALNGRAAALARDHWPGPLTIVLPIRAALASAAGKDTCAVRIPGSAAARALADAFGKAVTSTSANISGDEPLYSGAAVRRVFAARGESPDLLLDAGTLPRRAASTIVEVRHGTIVVLRAGAIDPTR
jgi:L-threonylcarbamoyladenylate synthase